MCEPEASWRTPGPAGAQALPDPAERADRRELPRPEALGVEELERIASLDPEQERIRREHERCDREAGEASAAVGRAPGDERERRQQGDRDRAGQEREAAHEPCAEEAPALSEQERGDAQEEVERLAVHGLQEERHREQREVEDGSPRAFGAQPSLGQPVQEHEGREPRRERDDDPGEDVVAEEDPARAGRPWPDRAGRRRWPTGRGARSRARRCAGRRRCPSGPRRP